MKFFSVFAFLAASAATAYSQTIELGYPTDGTVLSPGETVEAQVVRPNSIIGCTEVGIALAINSCPDGECTPPSSALGNVLYAGPFTPTAHVGDGYYQNFTVTIPDYLDEGSAIFTLTHLCLLGAGAYPLLEYRNASVTVA
ncbi:hypothetical protein BV22DRAFT_1198763 [Leucogyrophana mollusca]|uniref:Uncharacterized protein n=1 Tax=Leucogyrophana mollusca TaxID=85980 RepID=A0ACB8B544_9AGAM|nr:hypothetical protein BV22DRAFT_1198763 [Leucogyrophana mollusca]